MSYRLLRESAYIGRDNVIRLELSEDGVLFSAAYPAITPTRWVLTIAQTVPVVVDSDITASAFDYDSVTSILQLSLGGSVSVAEDNVLTTLVMYAAEWPDGLVWLHPSCTPSRLEISVCTA